ncbi:hypothetical protein ABMA28_015229 [Loxostege sticticalis]|uniref:Reverse transcriptase domain-containing protein n=1 Tax=Loxostege sticticalis TaxID=481309 RepID=A0ABD0TER4_LOXSC
MENCSHINIISNCSSTQDFFKILPPKCKLNFTCLHLNIRSMIKNFTKLLQLIGSCPFPLDIIVLTEVGIANCIAPLFNIPGYNMFKRLRNGKRGGGVIVYVKNHIKFTEYQHKSQTFENITGTLKLSQTESQDVVVCAVYKPPRTNKKIFVKELGNHVSKFNSKHNFLLVGDTNIDLKTVSSYKDSYLDTLGGCGLTCGVSDYTRIEKKLNKTTRTCIDHIFARFPACLPYSAVLDVVLADHRALIFTCIGNAGPKRIQGVCKKIDREILYTELKKIKWCDSNDMYCPRKIYDFICNSFSNAYKTATVEKKITSRTNSKVKFPWIDENINRLCDKRNKLFNAWKNSTNDPELRLNYNKIRNKIHRLLEKKRNSYYLKIINVNFKNTKKVYQIVNEMLGRVTSSIDSVILKAFDAQGLSVKNITNNFATTLENAVKDIIPNCSVKLLDPDSYDKTLDKSMLFNKASRGSIYKIINKLNSNKSPGIDNVRISDIKMVAEEVSVAFANLINASISCGTYPDELKVGCVRPVHKKGAKNNYMNYRPITLLSSVDKVVEKYVSQEIHKFYKNHEIITQNQYGFQSGKSTTQLLSKFTDEVNSYLNDRKHVLVLFIDFSRAFDTLDHKELIKKLDHSGVRGPLLRWCENYLHNRKFTVKVNDTYSDYKVVTEGTAQGSFADDTCLIASDKDPQKASERLQSDFNLLMKWCHDAGLVLNSDKTKLLCIKSPFLKSSPYSSVVAHSHSCLHVSWGHGHSCNCPSIENVDQQKYLGLIIDSRMNWGPHIEHVCDKLRQFLANLIILKDRIPFKVKLMLYNSLVESHIQYGLSSYGRTYSTYTNSIFNLQRRILRLLVSTNIKKQFYDDDNGLFNYCQVLPVETQFQYSILKENFFKEQYIDEIKHHHPVCTRAAARNQLELRTMTGTNNTYGKRTTAYLVPRFINDLPPDLRSIHSVKPHNIKIKLKTYFLNKMLTS